MTIDRVATAARTSASRPGSMDELMVFAMRSGAIASPNAPVDRRVKTEYQSKRDSPRKAVCLGIALAISEMPTELAGRRDLRRRLNIRGDSPEYRFFYRHANPRLSIWRDGQFQIVRWGNGRGQSRVLPRTGWTWQPTLTHGGWLGTDAALIDIPANYGLERRGVWFLIEVGIRGILVPDQRGIAVCYMVCEPASHYYRIMTGATRMPVLIDQRI